jgi:hypothetical protein
MEAIMIEINSDLYGEAARFNSLEEAEQCIRDCGSDFADVALRERNGLVYNEDGQVVGRELTA